MSNSVMTAVRGATVGLLVLVGVSASVLVPLYLLIGPERLLVGASLEFNSLWIGVAMVVSLFAASLAGWLAHRAAGGLAGVALLTAVVVAYGLGDAMLHHWLMPQLSLVRDGLSVSELLIGLREPLWYDLSGPVLMAIFIWVAASSRQIEASSTDAPGRSSGGPR